MDKICQNCRFVNTHSHKEPCLECVTISVRTKWKNTFTKFKPRETPKLTYTHDEVLQLMDKAKLAKAYEIAFNKDGITNEQIIDRFNAIRK